ncbi:hypothetical protein HKK80_10590 [Halonotius sp. F2-221B]|uniref:hypothetical protein n=1 Tax=Halonotius sp. F2-221B TaxID=2731620 RepID=UPI00398AE8E8
MYDRDERPLGAVAESAYEVLLETIDPENGITRSDAHERLLEADYAEADAEYAIDRLLSRGYLYDVNSQLFVTEDEDFEEIE